MTNNPEYNEIIAYVTEEAKRQGVPPAVAVATLRTETGDSLKQWDNNGNVLVSGNDYGLFQINKPSWSNQFDWEKIKNDWKYNVRSGITILKGSWNAALKAKEQGKVTDPVRSVYDAYNAGEGNVTRRSWTSSIDWPAYDKNNNKIDDRDENYDRYYNDTIANFNLNQGEFKFDMPLEDGEMYHSDTSVIGNATSGNGGWLDDLRIKYWEYSGVTISILVVVVMLFYMLLSSNNITLTKILK